MRSVFRNRNCSNLLLFGNQHIELLDCEISNMFFKMEQIRVFLILYAMSVPGITSGTTTNNQEKVTSSVLNLLKQKTQENRKEETELTNLLNIVTEHQKKIDDILERLNKTEHLIGKENEEGRRIRRSSEQDLPSSQTSGCTSGTIGCPGGYTPYFMGQCFMCPPGPTGPQGPSGSEGERGRDGRDGRDGDRGPKGDIGNCEAFTDTTNSRPTSLLPSNTSGVVYVRWGRTECPDTSELIYAGIAGGEWYNNKGGASNYLCLPQEPIYDEPEVSAHSSRGYVYGAEYETHYYPPYAHLHNNEVPCAVCKAVHRHSYMMVPARNTCPGSDWTREYFGHLMTAHNSHWRTEYVCIDRNAEAIPRTAAGADGALFYPVESRCSSSGGIPCGPYVNGYELTCAVCTL